MRPLVACFAILAVSRPAMGMQMPRIEPGTRIQFEAPSLGGWQTGTLLAWESDTLLVRVEGDAPGLGLRVPADSITQLAVRRERAMTLEGAGVGLLAGTLLALAASPDWVDENGNCTTPECLAYKVSPRLNTRLAVFGGVGLLLGTIVGSETKTRTWATVNLRRVNVSGTQDGGFALGLRIPL